MATALSEVARAGARRRARRRGGVHRRRADAGTYAAVEMEHPVPGDAARLAAAAGTGRPAGRHDGGRRWRTGTVVRMSRRLPPSAPPLTADRMDDIRAGLDAPRPGHPAGRAGASRTSTCIAALDEVRTPARRPGPAQRRAGGDQPRRDGALPPALRRAGGDQPGRGRALRRAGREVGASCVRRARPRPGSWPTSATSCGPRSPRSSGWCGCSPTRLGPAHRRAAPTGRADPRLGRGPAVAGQRPARPGQGGVRPDRAGVVRGRPARRCSASCAAPCGRWPPGPRWTSWSTAPATAAAIAYRRGAARPGRCATCCTNALKFTEQGDGAADRAPVDGRPVEFTVADTGIGIARRAPRTDLRGVLPGARQPRQLTGKGTGLGLPYARRLVGILGGALRVDCEHRAREAPSPSRCRSRGRHDHAGHHPGRRRQRAPSGTCW